MKHELQHTHNCHVMKCMICL